VKIFADKLVTHLQRQTHPIYFVAGNEPLLVNESRETLRDMAVSHGFEAAAPFVLDNQADWNAIYNACTAMSLFASKNLVELTIPDSGPGAANAKQLVSLVEQLTPDTLLLLTASKLNKQVESSKWYKALTKQGCCISCMTPDSSRLPQFVRQRCHALGLQADAEAVQLLAHWHEGNLLALSQSLQKLLLIYPDKQLTLNRVKESLSRHNHFTVFHWTDAMLAGKSNRALRILSELKAEGVEPVIMLRTVQKELLLLASLSQQMLTTPVNTLFDQHRIWSSKRPQYQAALTRLSQTHVTKLIQLLAQLERSVKTDYEANHWLAMQHFTLATCVPSALGITPQRQH
jgi:DNA polymerase-3 subunit delta